MHGRRQRPEQVSTGFVFTALVLGLILMPFIKCGQAIGCVSEDFGEAKALVTDEEEGFEHGWGFLEVREGWVVGGHSSSIARRAGCAPRSWFRLP